MASALRQAAQRRKAASAARSGRGPTVNKANFAKIVGSGLPRAASGRAGSQGNS